MADVTFPAHITLTEEADLDGLPILTAEVTVASASAALPLPAGPEGPAGPPGEPQSPFIKMGEIANIGARPTGLTAADRGKWWHRLDNDSMDYWDGDSWINCATAVGVQGVTAPANALTPLAVISNAATTIAAVDIKPVNSSEQTIQLTVPAGDRGATGAAGSSGAILTSPDYDSTQGPVERSTFGYHRVSKRFRPLPPPCGYGPWHWGASSFAADASGAVDAYDVLTASFPALPFAWRPVCHGGIRCYAGTDVETRVLVYARLWNSTGIIVGAGAGFFPTFEDMIEIHEHWGDPNAKPLSPSSDYGVVPANYTSQIMLRVERGNGTGTIGYKQALASFTVYAQPVKL